MEYPVKMAIAKIIKEYKHNSEQYNRLEYETNELAKRMKDLELRRADLKLKLDDIRKRECDMLDVLRSNPSFDEMEFKKEIDNIIKNPNDYVDAKNIGRTPQSV